MLERKRLHISPFSPELLSIILPGAILESATNLSFHALQTFPDRNYGYVDLPIVEADKVKKRFHGSILKGSRMRVEVARPEKTRNTSDGDAIEPERGSSPKTKKKGKRKMDDDVIPGFELPEGRKVQRGWTEPAMASKASKKSKTTAEKSKKKSSKAKSTFSDGPECLFRTKLPANAPELGKAAAADGKMRKRKRGESGRDVVVHEFANTTKHATFLKEGQGDTGKKSASEYIDEKGWVDEDGNTVEPEPPTRRTRSASSRGKRLHSESERAEPVSSVMEKTGEMSSMGITSSEATAGRELDDETSSSGTSSSSENDSENDESPKPSSGSAENRNPEENEVHSPIDDDVTSQTQAISISTTPAPEVHPLEALFKRPKTAASSTPKKPTLELSTSFTFFGDSHNGEPDNPAFLMPQTPFTQQDFRARRQRSAAPTPDTAAPGKTFGDVWTRGGRVSESDDDDDDNDDDDDDGNDEIDAGAGAGAGADNESQPPHYQKSESPSPNTRARTRTRTSTLPEDQEPTNDANVPEQETETEFQKWFWEHRGENNRAWKRRRREAGREKRKEDNKNQSEAPRTQTQTRTNPTRTKGV